MEGCLLEALARALPPAPSSLVRAQVRQVNRASRLPGWVAVTLSAVRWGRRRWEPGSLFPNRAHLELARASFRVGDGPGAWDVRFFAVDGHLGELVIRPGPRPVSFAEGIRVGPVELRDDPMRPSPDPGPAGPAEAPPVELRGWLRGWVGPYGARALAPPPTAAAVAAARARCECRWPPEYREIVRQADGLELEGGSVTILGIGGVREVHLEDADYYLLAAMTDGDFLAVRREDETGTVYRVGPYAESDARGTSFRRAVERAVHDERGEHG